MPLRPFVGIVHSLRPASSSTRRLIPWLMRSDTQHKALFEQAPIVWLLRAALMVLQAALMVLMPRVLLGGVHGAARQARVLMAVHAGVTRSLEVRRAPPA